MTWPEAFLRAFIVVAAVLFSGLSQTQWNTTSAEIAEMETS